MDLLGWALYAFITAAIVAAVALHYRLREPGGRGRGLLIGLRSAVLALVVLLLFDPVLPAAAGGVGGSGTMVLLDGSLSMRLPEEGGESRWEAARRITAAAGADRVLRFGGDAVEVAEATDEPGPTGTGSRLEPAIRAAAESGARQVIVVTDAGLEDAGEALGLAARSGLAVDVRRVGGAPVGNAAVAEVRAPAWMEVDEEAGVEVALAAVGPVGDSLTVVLRQGSRELARSRVAAPTSGRMAMTTLRFTPGSAAAAPVRLDVALEGTDAERDDDERSVYVRIADEPAGIALVSFMPDQEPRFLLPVLERALGVPVRGWMALPEGRYIRLGAGPDAGLGGTEAEARRAVAEADLVVLHGLGAASPAWARAAAEEARRLLVFPSSASPEGLPFAPGPSRPGDWYPAAEIPASPVASLMVGLEPGDAPPLESLRTPEVPTGWWGALNARLGRRGDGRPVLVAGTEGGRRIAIALGDGYWRWGFAERRGREVYDRLWSAVAGWLMSEEGGRVVNAVAPVDRVVARGGAVRFRAPGGVDSVQLRLLADGGEGPAVDGVLEVRDGVIDAGPIPPGRYRYEATPFVEGRRGGASTGELTVERYSPEFTRAAVALEPASGAAEAEERVVTGGRPLRASAWPYLILVLLLCAEWVLRRRWGLR